MNTENNKTSSLPFDLSNHQMVSSLYDLYLKDPSKLDPTLKAFFDGYRFGQGVSADQKQHTNTSSSSFKEWIRKNGHRYADINPLKPLDSKNAIKTAFSGSIDEKAFQCYAGKVGFEVDHISNQEDRHQIYRIIEEGIQIDDATRQSILYDLIHAEAFEHFLHKRFFGKKRFSIEGGESLIPMLNALCHTMHHDGCQSLVMAMSHRGRLNVLANVMQKPLEAIFKEFDNSLGEGYQGLSGDVYYHLGYQHNVHDLSLFLMDNPSHLESVDGVVQGYTRALQDASSPKQVISLTMHGDAAFSGQGVVYETLQMAKTNGYSTGGSLHLVVNNQLGFTASKEDYNSTHYVTDIAKGFDCPIIHVNGDHPEDCVKAILYAFKMRQTLSCDVFIDLICYRKYGHNETDEPTYTQPEYYTLLKNKPFAPKLYEQKLLSEGNFIKEDAYQAVYQDYHSNCDAILDQLKKHSHRCDTSVKKTQSNNEEKPSVKPLSEDMAKAMIKKLYSVDTTANKVHPKLDKQMKKKLSDLEQGTLQVDWALAESLAFANLLSSGISVRLSGEDSIRGTFSHRHASIVNQETSHKLTPLKQFEDGSKFHVYNSILSEFAVLGFDYGYSLARPHDLTIWEAQFGDFANGGQIIFDQYIASSYQKWGRSSSLVTYLPHGYSGLGPEHSSARIERYMQLAAEDNIYVLYPTNAKQLYSALIDHTLRQSLFGHTSYHRPMMIMTPKEVLRYTPSFSPLKEFIEHSHYEPVLDHKTADPTNATTLLFVSGKIAYEIIEAIQKQQLKHIAVISIEMLYPFQGEKLLQIIDEYRNKKVMRYVQEEPKNMGYYPYLLTKANEMQIDISYIGRPEAAVTATGFTQYHKTEQERIIKEAIE